MARAIVNGGVDLHRAMDLHRTINLLCYILRVYDFLPFSGNQGDILFPLFYSVLFARRA